MKVELDKVKEIVKLARIPGVILDELDKLEAEENSFCKGETCKHFKDAFKREGKPTLICCDKLKEGYSFPLGVFCGDYEPKDHPKPCCGNGNHKYTVYRYDNENFRICQKCERIIYDETGEHVEGDRLNLIRALKLAEEIKYGKTEPKTYLHWYINRETLNVTCRKGISCKASDLTMDNLDHIKTEVWNG